MKVLAVVLFLATLVTSQAQAEPKQFASIQQCNDEPGWIFNMVQQQYGEIPFLNGTAVIQAWPTSQWLTGEFYMTVNPDTMTFSIIMRDPASGLECLWLAGEATPAGVGQ